MGVIRKTMSISTLGIVPFRSKKEKLRRAERSQREAELELEHERAARTDAEQRIAAAEKRVKQAQSDAATAAKHRDEKKKKGSRGSRKSKIGAIVAATEPIVRDQVDAARHARGEVTVKGRKALRRARKAAKQNADAATRATKRAAERSADKAKEMSESARDAVVTHGEDAIARATELVDRVTSS